MTTATKPKRRRTSNPDTQRSAVYAWDSALEARWPESLGTTLSLAECRALVERVWRDYHGTISPPEVTDGRMRRSAAGSHYRIALPRSGRSVETVLHELAHAILDETSVTNDKHGPRFATLSLELFARYGGVDKAVARKMAIEQRPRRVHFAKIADVPKPLSREYRVWMKRLDELDAEARDLARRRSEHFMREPQR